MMKKVEVIMGLMPIEQIAILVIEGRSDLSIGYILFRAKSDMG